jgi:hypothetical protein
MRQLLLKARIVGGVLLMASLSALLLVMGGVVSVRWFPDETPVPVTMHGVCVAVGVPTASERDDSVFAGSETEPLLGFSEDGVLAICEPSDEDVVIVGEAWDWVD